VEVAYYSIQILSPKIVVKEDEISEGDGQVKTKKNEIWSTTRREAGKTYSYL